MAASLTSFLCREHHVWRHPLEVLCGAPSVLAAVQGEALGAMYVIVDESKAKLFLEPTEFRHLLAPFRHQGGWCVDKGSPVGVVAVFGEDRRWSRRGDDA